jgi:hypothetical protein
MALTNRSRTRSRTAPKIGTLVAFILVLLFGSPIYTDWALEHTSASTAGGWWLRVLAWPHWWFTDTEDSIETVFSADLRAILVVLLTFVFLYLLPGSQLARARGSVSQFFAGWAAYVFAGGFAGLLTTVFWHDPSLYGAFGAAGDGATYGLFVGWIIGLATLGAQRGTR